jgi:hypothetical protein
MMPILAQVMNAELLAALDQKGSGVTQLEVSLAEKEAALAQLGTAQKATLLKPP